MVREYIVGVPKRATSAYNNSKNFSPRFKTSAEYVEGYLTPIANTVGSVGRVTGVEGGVRWFLGEGRRPSDLEAGQGSSNKRRKVRGDDMVGVVVDPAAHILAAAAVAEQESNRDSYLFKHDRRLSRASTIDTLPAYDESRSPAYTEDDKQNAQRGSAAEARKSRLVISTSGLAVSMSKESLRSLKYCLRWLRLANDHIGGVVGHLKTTLEQYDKAAGPGQEVKAEQSPDGETMEVDGRTSNDTEHQEDPTVLAARITALKADILKNLQAAIETVSKYAGGALPENARVLVHRQITSLPQRFRYASMVEQQQNQEGGERQQEEMTREGANRVLVLAKEGLDMITQVSGVIDGTIVSAEEWCDRLGSKRKDEGSVLPEAHVPRATAVSHTLRGQVLGLIGLGNIGHAIAARAAFGFGMAIHYHDVYRKEAALETKLGATFHAELDDLLHVADCVVLCAPYAGRHIITAASLQHFKPGSRFVNVARGSLVDEPALADALEAGLLSSAALDVHAAEPAVHPRLAAMAGTKAFLTCHNAGGTVETHAGFEELSMRNIMAVLAGQAAVTPVNLEHLRG
ncbi:hypothetical protein BN1708_012669 [Verticillium longisporum]|uniref:D-isomer specific 2-hydroxyacid dehydrogenase NAD-binding domain-containing protein n=1 Tax=Verticillium longisporum TaxID=100787 RepID=A0A0G4LC01_VERLO|nr:hypothetical protein BN1708_012669 [Verticillium longisporum]